MLTLDFLFSAVRFADGADLDAARNTRIIPCSCCGGDGGHEVAHGIDYRDGSLLGDWRRCVACGGTGDEEIEGEPVEEADLGDIPAQTEEPR